MRVCLWKDRHEIITLPGGNTQTDLLVGSFLDNLCPSGGNGNGRSFWCVLMYDIRGVPSCHRRGSKFSYGKANDGSVLIHPASGMIVNMIEFRIIEFQTGSVFVSCLSCTIQIRLL